MFPAGALVIGGTARGTLGWVGAQQKTVANLMDLVRLMNAAPRCSATSKRSHQKCRAPAVRGCRVCRFHGARGGAPKGKANGAWRHGRHTSQAVMLRRLSAILTRSARKTINKL